MKDIEDRALSDARSYLEAGFDGIIIENFGDAPFRSSQIDAVTIAAMTRVAVGLRKSVPINLGINALRNDANGALGIAAAVDAEFIRVNVHTGVSATDQGLIEGRADQTLRDRSVLGVEVAIFADVHVKHATSLSHTDIGSAAADTAYRGGADALIVSGTGTGKPVSSHDLEIIKSAVPDRPLLVGSGATIESVADLLELCDGVIVGTDIKVDRQTEAPVDPDRAREFVSAARG